MKTASKILALLGLTASTANATFLDFFYSPQADAEASVDSE